MTENNNIKRLSFTAVASATKEIPKPTINSKSEGWLSWGVDNKFPNYLMNLYENSSQFNAIAQTMKDYILGDEIVNYTNLDKINRKGQTFEDLLNYIVLDYIIFGGYAFQVVRNHYGNVSELNYIDFRTARTNEDEDRIFINPSWKKDTAKRGIQTKVYDKFNPSLKQANSIYYYKGNNTREVYPVPIYQAAITSLEISTQISNYHLHNILNNFTPSAIINFNQGSNLPEDVMADAEEKVYSKFCGTDNAGNILLSFNDNAEQKTTIERLADDGLDNKYQTLAQATKNDIYSAFRINEVLVGLNKDTGFSKTEFSEAFTLYNRTVIRPIQKALIDSLEKVFGNNCLEIKPFTIDWSESEEDKNGPVGENAEIID